MYRVMDHACIMDRSNHLSHAHLQPGTSLAMAVTTSDGQRASDNYRSKFMSVFPDLVEELTNNDSNGEIRDGIEHLKKVLNYNVPGGELLLLLLLEGDTGVV